MDSSLILISFTQFEAVARVSGCGGGGGEGGAGRGGGRRRLRRKQHGA